MAEARMNRSRWAAIGAAVAVTLGAGGFGLARATEPDAAAAFVPITPCRIFDTRPEFQVGPRSSPLGPNDTHTVTAHGTNGDCTLPTSATGLALNVTAVGATLPTFLAVFPADVALPNASNLNPAPGQPPTPNAVTTDLSATGQFSVYNKQGSVYVFADVVGYYTDHTHDDRYYTKAEIDAGAGPAWMVPMAPAAATNDGTNAFFSVAGGGSSGTTGLYLLESGFGRFHHGFALPDQYQAGTDVRVDITWGAETNNATGCAFRFELNQLDFYREGSQIIRPSAEFENPLPSIGFPRTNLIAPASLGAGNGFQMVTQHTFLTIDGTQLQPGDHAMIALNRRAGAEAADTCTNAMIVLGMSVGPA